MNGDLAQKIRELALNLGFGAVAFTDCQPLDEAGERLQKWLEAHFHGSMAWMKRTARQRSQPDAFFPEARSIICLAHNYYRQEEPRAASQGNISLYARGRDYHKVIRKKSKKLLRSIQELEPQTRGRICVDSFPLMEKPLAVKAGLGWIGKHTNLIIKGKGSYFFLSEILLNIELPADPPFAADHCGSCNRCQVACPTDALDTAYLLDASRCISYLTIEHDDAIKPALAGNMENWIFGCDICQDVCPWTRFSSECEESDFQDRLPEAWRDLDHLANMSEEQFDLLFAGTPVRRTGYRNFLRNVRIARRNLQK